MKRAPALKKIGTMNLVRELRELRDRALAQPQWRRRRALEKELLRRALAAKAATKS